MDTINSYGSSDASYLEYEVISPENLRASGQDALGGVFSHSNITYDYRRHLTNSGQELSNFAQYDKLLKINLRPGYTDWAEALSDQPDFIHTIVRSLSDILEIVCEDTYDHWTSSTNPSLFNQFWRGVNSVTDSGQVSSTALSRNRMGQDSSSGLATFFATTFNIQNWMWPGGVQFYKSDGYSNNHFRREMFTATHGPNMWKQFPLESIYIPLPSEAYMQFRYENDDEGDVLALTRCYYSLVGSEFLNIMASDSNYGYYRSDSYEQESVMFYNYVDEKWQNKPGYQWPRGYRHCNMCNQIVSNHFVTQYREINQWVRSRGRGDYACFICTSLFMTNYNVDSKLFIYNSQYGNELTEYNRTYEDDYLVNFMHGHDLPTARGSRDYLVEVIDDDDWQSSEFMQSGIDVSGLPIQVRKFMSWTRNHFINQPGDDKTAVVRDSRYILHCDYNQSALAYERAEDGWHDHDLGQDITGRDQMVQMQVDIPVVQVLQPDEGLRENMEYFLVLRVDSMDESRRVNTQTRSRTTAPDDTRTSDDGWLEPAHGMTNMNVAKNEYQFRPPFFYVGHNGNEFTAVPADVQSRGVDDNLACECGTCQGQAPDSNVAHISSHHWHRKVGLHMGMELELVARDTRLWEDSGYHELFARTVHTFHRPMYNVSGSMPQLTYAKRDGSLPSGTGVEFIMQPMTLEAYKHVPEMFWLLVEGNYKAFGLEDVGIHIHMPWPSLDKAHGYAFLSALNIMQLQRTTGLLEHVAQRTHGTYAQWDLLEYRDAQNTIAEVVKQRKATNSEKYKAINLMHAETIELRYFKSNAKGPRILKNLEFVDALYNATLLDTLGTDGWSDMRDMPTDSLIDLANQYSNQSTKYKIDGVHSEGQPFGLYIEDRITSYVRSHMDKYPNLYAFMFGETDEESDNTPITLFDIGEYDNIEEEVVDTPDIEPERKLQVFMSPSRVTIQGTEHFTIQQTQV